MASVKIILKTNRKLNDGTYPIVISLAHLKLPTTYIRIKGLSAYKEQWSKSLSRFKPSKGDNYKKLNASLGIIEDKLEDILEQLSVENKFSYELFKEKYFENDKINNCVEDAYRQKISRLYALNKDGTATFYKSSLKAIKKFHGDKKLSFDDITYRWLNDFEHFERLEGKSGNTIAVYLRGIRSIHYEHCRINNFQQPNIYRRFNVQRLLTPTRKRSLSKEQLIQFISLDPDSAAQKNAKLIFLFSFYTRGLNLMDIVQLTKKNMENDYLVYRRQKTGKPMRIKLIKEAQLIIDYFKNETKYLFPYLRKDDNLVYRVKDVNSNINRRLKKLGKQIGADNLSMYYARHTFAELNYKAGVRIEIISQMLGHSDLKTTQVYLRSFSDDEVDAAAETIFNSL